MTDGQKSFWISIGAGVVLSVAAAPAAYMFWKYETSERALIKSELAQLNSKIAKSSETLAQLQTTASVQGIAKELQLINARIKTANDALAGVQKATSLEGVVKEIGRLDAGIKSANDAIKRTGDALADIKKTASLDGVTQALGQIEARIKSANDALTEIQKATMTTGTASSARAPGLENSIGELRKRIDDERASRGKLSEDIARLQDALRTQSAPKAKPEPAAERNDVVVFYVQSPDAMARAQAAAPIPPMSVRFEKIGSLDDSGQADMVVQKLKAITKGKTGCSVTVAGYADTLGDDKINLAISKKRARAIAAKLQTAFAGAPVQITEAAWGERRLQEWTPNNVAREANRRVDVSVNCKGE